MKLGMFSAVCGVVALASAASAPARPVSGWDVNALDSGNGCYVSRFVEKDVMVGFHYMPGNREFRVVMANPGWDALVADGERRLPLDFRLTMSGKSKTVSTQKGHIMSLKGGVEAVAAMWYNDEGADLRKDLRKASALTLMVDGKAVGTYPLQDPGAAIDALLECAAGLGKN